MTKKLFCRILLFALGIALTCFGLQKANAQVESAPTYLGPIDANLAIPVSYRKKNYKITGQTLRDSLKGSGGGGGLDTAAVIDLIEGNDKYLSNTNMTIAPGDGRTINLGTGSVLRTIAPFGENYIGPTGAGITHESNLSLKSSGDLDLSRTVAADPSFFRHRIRMNQDSLILESAGITYMGSAGGGPLVLNYPPGVKLYFNNTNPATKLIGFDANNGLKEVDFADLPGSEVTLTGAITGSGTGSITTAISNNAVGNTKLSDMPALTVKGNKTTGTADPADLTANDLLALLGIETGTYTPTELSLINATGLTFSRFMYKKVGNMVTLSGRIQYTSTTSGTNTEVTFSLPFPSDFTSTTNLTGCVSTLIDLPGFGPRDIRGSIADDAAYISISNQESTGNVDLNLLLFYEIQ